MTTRLSQVLMIRCSTPGIIAGLRAMTAPAAVGWAAKIGWLNLAPTSDPPAPFIEDAVASGGAILILAVLP